MTTLSRILWPTDFSEASAEAAKYAFALADRFGAELHALHVVEDIAPTLPASAAHMASFPQDYLDRARSAHANRMYEQFQAIAEEAKRFGLGVVAWSYPRGEQISKEGETALDVVSYAAHIAAQLGAHLIKVKLPTDHVEAKDIRELYDRHGVARATQAERVRHVVASTFAGRRIVIFSGGTRKSDEGLLNDVRAIREGGGFGSIVGRNAFQRPREQAVSLLRRIVEIYSA